MRNPQLKQFLDYLRYEELTSNSTTTKNDVDEFLLEVKKGRWDRTKKELRLND